MPLADFLATDGATVDSGILLYFPHPHSFTGEDVIELAHVFIDAFRKRSGGRSVSLTPEVRETFLRYPWPGNVRELQHVVERAAGCKLLFRPVVVG